MQHETFRNIKHLQFT